MTVSALVSLSWLTMLRSKSEPTDLQCDWSPWFIDCFPSLDATARLPNVHCWIPTRFRSLVDRTIGLRSVPLHCTVWREGQSQVRVRPQLFPLISNVSDFRRLISNFGGLCSSQRQSPSLVALSVIVTVCKQKQDQFVGLLTHRF